MQSTSLDNRWPDFLVIGAAKSGTTALDEFLRQHPDLLFPETREPNYFAFPDGPPAYRDHRGDPAAIARTTVSDAERYLSLFPQARAGQLRGETSPAYLYVPGTAERIAAVRPDARLVVILRDPAARAFSAYQHLRREDREPLSFAGALDAEPQRIRASWGLLWRYVDTGRYGRQLTPYLDAFPRRQLLLLRHEDLARDPAAVCRHAFTFLGVPRDVEVDTTGRFNVSGVPRSRFLHRLTNPPASVRRTVARVAPTGMAERLRAGHARATARNLRPETPDPEDLARVRDTLADDRRLLERITGWDLAAWG